MISLDDDIFKTVVGSTPLVSIDLVVRKHDGEVFCAIIGLPRAIGLCRVAEF
ncbi:MAG: hypothetical protein ACPF9O_07275 [Cycloclasticus sp.]|jgi:hypothetical protein